MCSRTLLRVSNAWLQEPTRIITIVNRCRVLYITATKCLSTKRTTCVGVMPQHNYSESEICSANQKPKYSWLGGEQQPTELPSGVIEMGARSYVRQLGRFLQTDPVPGGSANAYAYTFGDPVNSSDPRGELTYGFSGWLKEQNNQEAQAVVAREVAREALEREEAERRAREAAEAAAAAAAAAAIPAEAAAPLGGYPGWACEYAAETQQEGAGCGGGGSLTAGATRIAGRKPIPTICEWTSNPGEHHWRSNKERASYERVCLHDWYEEAIEEATNYAPPYISQGAR